VDDRPISHTPSPAARSTAGTGRRGGRGRFRLTGRFRRFDLRRALKWSVPLALAALVGVVAGVGFAAAIHVPQVEDVQDLPSLITQVRDRGGDVFGTFSVERRMLMTENEIPPLLRDAVIAIEDPRFFQHGGVDALAVVRAQIANLRAGEIVEGASTLTMQLARDRFLTRDKEWSRKIEEAFLAVEIEKHYTKEQILALYLNVINVGHGNWGMKAAARYYFNKEVGELTLPEAATLAGIVQTPSRYSPYKRPDLVRARRDRVLAQMLEEGFVTRDEYEAAVATPLLVVTHGPRHRLAPYFAEDVRKHLVDAYGEDAVKHAGLQAWTTLDPQIQRSAEAALRDELIRLDHRKGWRGPVAHVDGSAAELAAMELPSWTGVEPEPGRWVQGLVVAVDRGEVTVKIEGRTYPLTAAGIAWTRRSSPAALLEPGDVVWFRLEASEGEGSEGEGERTGDGGDGAEEAAEPRLMLEQEPELDGAVVVIESATGAVRAMAGGWDFERSKFNRATQAQRQVGSAFKPFVYGAALEAGFTPADTVLDAPAAFVGADNQLSYRPRNYSRDYYGIVTLRRALEQSANVTAVKLLDMVGVDQVIDFTRRCGITAQLPPYPSLALGVADLTPLELATAYAAIANQGTWVEPYLIERVEDAGGRVLERHQAVTRPAIEARVAYVLAHVLEGVIDRGTGAKAAGLEIDLAGKTGTTDDFSDAWFVGFTPRYTLLTWVGYDLKKPIGRGMTGAEAALPMWMAIVEDGLEDGWLAAGERFGAPSGITVQTVEYRTGLLPGPGAERFVEEAFVQGTEPVQRYEPQWGLIMELPWYQQRAYYIPKQGERMPWEFGADVEGDDGEDEIAAAAEGGRPAREPG
jgi:penicillin-binding protein 1A